MAEHDAGHDHNRPAAARTDLRRVVEHGGWHGRCLLAADSGGDDLKLLFDQHRFQAGVSTRAREDLTAIKRQAAAVGDAELVAQIEARAQPLAVQLVGHGARHDPGRPAILPYPGLHTEILALNSRILQSRGLEKPCLWLCERWSPLAMWELPPPEQSDQRLVLEQP